MSKEIFRAKIGWREHLVFYEDFLEYNKKKLKYKDIISTSFLATKTSVNGIPLGTNYKFMVRSEEHEFEIFPKNKEDWNTIISFLSEAIIPSIAFKLLDKINKGKNIEIGNVTFNKEGFRTFTFFGKEKFVSWNDNIYESRFSDGKLILFWKNPKEKVRVFRRISMDEDNAVVIPSLLEVCFLNNLEIKNNSIKKS